MITSNIGINTPRVDGNGEPVHAGDFVRERAVACGLLPDTYPLGLSLGRVLNDVRERMPRAVQSSRDSVTSFLQELNAGPGGGTLAEADARDIETFVRLPGLGRLHRPLLAKIGEWMPRARAFYVPQRGLHNDEQTLFAQYKALTRLPEHELGEALERCLMEDVKALPPELRAGALALLLRQFDRLPHHQRVGLWNVFRASIEEEGLSAARHIELTGKLASKIPLLPADEAPRAWDACIVYFIAHACRAAHERKFGESLIRAVERLPARVVGERQLSIIVHRLCSAGHELAALALIKTLALSPLWEPMLAQLAVLVASVFEVHPSIDGHPLGEVLLARLFPSLGERHLRQERMAVILQFAEASGGLHHAALLPVTSVGWKLANARVTRALGDPSTLADLPHMARLLKKKDLPKALRQCALIADPLKRQARLEEFRSDCEAPVLSEIARKWAQGDWALSGPEYQALHKDVESVPPFLITKTPKREVDEGMPALNRKTYRDGK